MAQPRVVTLGALPARPPKGKVFVVRFQYKGRRDFYRDFLIESGAKFLRMTFYAVHSPLTRPRPGLVAKPSRGTCWWEYSTRKPGVVDYIVKAAAQIQGVTSRVRLGAVVKP